MLGCFRYLDIQNKDRDCAIYFVFTLLRLMRQDPFSTNDDSATSSKTFSLSSSSDSDATNSRKQAMISLQGMADESLFESTLMQPTL